MATNEEYSEWLNLIEEAIQLGLTPEEIREFIEQSKLNAF